ncbi:hypothetical protein T3H97_25475 [Paenibacillus sp. LX16]|uniref:hypothetical protein n=1 Tax=Paenibacillus sp. LX16 TaxID=1740264 RepID=UPI002E2C4915|nr:hypothetical protein [Paenibacillus sp. LX16]
MKPFKVMTKTAIIAALTAILLPYGAIASANDAPNPLSSTIQSEAGKWEPTDEIKAKEGQVYKYIDPSSVNEDVYYYYVNYDNLNQEKGNNDRISTQSIGVTPIVKTHENLGYWVDTNNAIRVSTYTGPAAAKIAVKTNIKVKAEGAITGGVKAIEGTLGFGIEADIGLDDEYSINVPKGERWVISAFPRYEKHRLGMYWPAPFIGDPFIGYVRVDKPVGIAFRVEKH